MKLLLILGLIAATVVLGADAPRSNFDPGTGVDPVFASELAAVKTATRFIDAQPGEATAGWLPNLQLLIGVKAVEGTQRTIYFIELTTLSLRTNGVAARLPQPLLLTNFWGAAGTNQSSTSARLTYVSALYPLRVRVFDQRGRPRGEGEAALPWGLLPNGLAELCQLSLANTNSARGPTENHSGNPNAALRRSVGGTVLWLTQALEQVQTVPAVNLVWKKALCACRKPGMAPLVRSLFSGQSAFGLEMDLKEISPAGIHADDNGRGGYVLPVHLTCGSKELTRIDVTVAPPHGAGMILAGIRSVHATHPDKPHQEFTAQILAAGMARPGLN